MPGARRDPLVLERSSGGSQEGTAPEGAVAPRLHPRPLVDSVAPVQADVILVADADRQAGQSLAQHLAHRGHRASHTLTGEDALRLAHAGRLAAAIVDVTLADMSGHALVSRLKVVDPRIPVLMTTGDFRPELEVRARQIGILHYAHKPADPARIETIVTRAIGLARPA